MQLSCVIPSNNQLPLVETAVSIQLTSCTFVRIPTLNFVTFYIGISDRMFMLLVLLLVQVTLY